MGELEISDRAHEAGTISLRVHRADHRDMPDAAADVLHAAGPLVVAAELRRIAGTLRISDGVPDSDLARTCSAMYAHVAQVLHRRADELDPDGGA